MTDIFYEIFYEKIQNEIFLLKFFKKNWFSEIVKLD